MKTVSPATEDANAAERHQGPSVASRAGSLSTA
jgi:hypothetical protein